MSTDHTVIRSAATFQIVGDDPTVPVEGSLIYDSRDPYALRVSFHVDIGTTIDWLFARDLLCAGLVVPAGGGDVRIQPTRGKPDQLRFELFSPCGRAVLVAGAKTVRDFLWRTFEAVPGGTEYSTFDVDLALSQLLEQPT